LAVSLFYDIIYYNEIKNNEIKNNEIKTYHKKLCPYTLLIFLCNLKKDDENNQKKGRMTIE